MNKFQNVIILSSPYCIIGSNYSNDIIMDNKLNKVECVKFSKLPCLNNEVYANTVNYLYVINKYLEKILNEINKDKNNILCRFFINQKIYSIISKGTFKYWILNGKTEGSQNIICEEERKAWEKFSLLYSKLFFHITFTSLNFIMTKNIKYNYTNIVFSQNVINSMVKELEKENEINLSNLLKMD